MIKERKDVVSKYAYLIDEFEMVLRDNPDTIFSIPDMLKYMGTELAKNYRIIACGLKRGKTCKKRLSKYDNYSEVMLSKYIWDNYMDELMESWSSNYETTIKLVNRIIENDPKITRWYGFNKNTLFRNINSSRTRFDVPKRIRTHKRGDVDKILETIAKDVMANPRFHTIYSLSEKYDLDVKTLQQFFKYRARGKELIKYVCYNPRTTKNELEEVRWLKAVDTELESGLTIRDIYRDHGFETANDMSFRLSMIRAKYRS